MKTTLEIDDELYREAKAHASLTGRKMKDLVTDGLRLAIQHDLASPLEKSSATHGLEACFADADRVIRSAPKDRTARDHLNQSRNRLDPS